MLHHANPTNNDLMCMFVPSRFHYIRFEQDDNLIEVNQTNKFLSHNYYRGTQVTHLDEKKIFFNQLITQLGEPFNLANLTNAQLVDMIRKTIPIHDPGFGMNFQSLISYASLFLASGIAILLFQWRRRKWNCPWRHGEGGPSDHAPSVALHGLRSVLPGGIQENPINNSNTAAGTSESQV